MDVQCSSVICINLRRRRILLGGGFTFCGSIKIRALFKSGISVPESAEGLLGALNLEDDGDEKDGEDVNDEVDYKMTISDENDDDDDDKIRSLWSEWRSAN